MKDTLIIEPLEAQNGKSGRRRLGIYAAKFSALLAMSLVFLSMGIFQAAPASAFSLSDIPNNIIDSMWCTQEGVTDGISNPSVKSFSGTAALTSGRLTDSPDVAGLPAEWVGVKGDDSNNGQAQLSARQYSNGGGGSITYFAKYRDGSDLPRSFDGGTGEELDKKAIVRTRDKDNNSGEGSLVPMLNDDGDGLTVDSGETYDGCTAYMSGAHISTIFSQMNLNMAASIIGFAGWTFDFAVAPNTLTEPLLGAVDTAITAPGGLRDSIYLPFLTIVGLFIGIWIFNRAWKGEANQIAGGVIWIAIAILLGAIFMAKPVLIPNIIQTFVTQFASSALGVISAPTNMDVVDPTVPGHISTPGQSSTYVAPVTTDSEGNPVNPDGTRDFTAVKNSAAVANSEYQRACATSIEDDFIKNTEIIKCSLWFNFVFEGWSIAQFGSPSSVVDDTYDSMDKEGIYKAVSYENIKLELGPDATSSISSFSLYAFMSSYPRNLDWADNSTAPRASARLAEITDTLNSAAIGTNPDTNTTGVSGVSVSELAKNWNGENPNGRFLSSSLSLLIAILGGSFIIFASLSILLNMMLVLFLTLITPLVFLFGVHPSGKPVVIQWANKLASILLKTIGQITVIIVAVTMFKIILLADIGYGVKTLTVILLTVVLFFYRDEIIAVVDKPNVFGAGGGSDTILGKALSKADTMAGKVDSKGDGLRRGLSSAAVGMATGAAIGAGSGMWASRGAIRDTSLGKGATLGAMSKSLGTGLKSGAKEGVTRGYTEGKTGVQKGNPSIYGNAKKTIASTDVKAQRDAGKAKVGELKEGRKIPKYGEGLSAQNLQNKVSHTAMLNGNRTNIVYDYPDDLTEASELAANENSEFQVMKHEGADVLTQIDTSTGEIRHTMLFALNDDTQKVIGEDLTNKINGSKEEIKKHKKVLAQTANEAEGTVGERAHLAARRNLAAAEGSLTANMKEARAKYLESELKEKVELKKALQNESYSPEKLDVSDNPLTPRHEPAPKPKLVMRRPNINRPPKKP